MVGSELTLMTLGGLTLAGGMGLLYTQLFGQEKQVRRNLTRLLDDSSSRHLQVASETRVAKKLRKSQTDSVLKKRSIDRKSWRYRLESDLERANLMVRVNEYLMFLAVLVVGVGAIGWLAWRLPLWAAVLVGAASTVLPTIGLNLRVWWRMRRARIQFPEVLDSMVSCFKTGYGFNRAVQQIADNYGDPWGTEFGKMALETSLGASLDELLANLYRRVPNPDVELFIASMLIQKDTGGNLTEMLGNLSHTCRERFKLTRKVAAISAQGKLTAGVVCCVPLLIMVLMYAFIGSAVQEFLANPVGQIIMAVMGVWMMIGMGVLWKMVQIDV